MKKLSRAYLVIAAFAAVGCVLLLIDRSEYDSADAFRNAVGCTDTSSDHCYQLYPGVIQTVHVDQTSLPVDLVPAAAAVKQSAEARFLSSADTREQVVLREL